MSSEDPKTAQWVNLNFAYKPGKDVRQSLTWVAPLQPRLDWQLWFVRSTFEVIVWYDLCRRLHWVHTNGRRG